MFCWFGLTRAVACVIRSRLGRYSTKHVYFSLKNNPPYYESLSSERALRQATRTTKGSFIVWLKCFALR